MEQIQLEATTRSQTGKGAVRQLRRRHLIPGVVYGKAQPPLSVALAEHDVLHALHTKAGTNVLINLHIREEHAPDAGASEPAQPAKGAKRPPARAGKGGGHTQTVLIKEVQHDAVDGSILHVDFHHVSLTTRIKIAVPVVPQGEAIGVRQDGGVIEHFLREVMVECLPTEIPAKIELDISPMKIGDTRHAKDLALPSGVTLAVDPESAVLSVLAPKAEVIEAAPTESGPAEPEVLKQKSPEELEAEAAAAVKEKEKEKKEKKE